MDEIKFWKIVEATHEQCGGDMHKKCEAVKAVIESLTNDEAIAFSRCFDEMMDKAYTWALWGAAYLIHGGCSDDSFADFRASLISRGQFVFENAVSNPDTLADEVFDENSWFYEGYQYAVSDGIQTCVGSEIYREKAHPSAPAGEEWEEDLEILKGKYPKLWESFEYVWVVPNNSGHTRKKPWWKFW